MIPPRYLSMADRVFDIENLAYLQWLQDSGFKILSFSPGLLTALLESVLPRVVKCVHAHDVWTTIDQFQRTQIYVRSRKLQSMEKGDRTFAPYLGRIQQIMDILESIGDPVSHRD